MVITKYLFPSVQWVIPHTPGNIHIYRYHWLKIHILESERTQIPIIALISYGTKEKLPTLNLLLYL